MGIMNNSRSYKVAAYITAFQDSSAVEACLSGIKEQSYPIQDIYIVDNSPQAIVENTHESLIIRHHPDNIGIGGGLALVLEETLKKNYDFLWTFDQDSVPNNNALEQLLKFYEKTKFKNRIGIIAPIAFDLRTNQIIQGALFQRDHFVGCEHQSNLPYQCDAPITSGSLIALEAVRVAGLPYTELFIDGVDFEYGMRLCQKGFQNFIIPQAVIHHEFGIPQRVKFLSKEKVLQIYSPLRHYYICRNHTYLEMQYVSKPYMIHTFLFRLKYFFNTARNIILFDNKSKLIKVWACFIGTWHGFQGKLGKTWRN